MEDEHGETIVFGDVVEEDYNHSPNITFQSRTSRSRSRSRSSSRGSSYEHDGQWDLPIEPFATSQRDVERKPSIAELALFEVGMKRLNWQVGIEMGWSLLGLIPMIFGAWVYILAPMLYTWRDASNICFEQGEALRARSVDCLRQYEAVCLDQRLIHSAELIMQCDKWRVCSFQTKPRWSECLYGVFGSNTNTLFEQLKWGTVAKAITGFGVIWGLTVYLYGRAKRSIQTH